MGGRPFETFVIWTLAEELEDRAQSAHYMQLNNYFAGILKNCFLEKTVGGVDYILLGWYEKKAKALGCQNACL